MVYIKLRLSAKMKMKVKPNDLVRIFRTFITGANTEFQGVSLECLHPFLNETKLILEVYN